jgi:hypothetical protein
VSERGGIVCAVRRIARDDLDPALQLTLVAEAAGHRVSRAGEHDFVRRGRSDAGLELDVPSAIRLAADTSRIPVTARAGRCLRRSILGMARKARVAEERVCALHDDVRLPPRDPIAVTADAATAGTQPRSWRATHLERFVVIRRVSTLSVSAGQGSRPAGA